MLKLRERAGGTGSPMIGDKDSAHGTGSAQRLIHVAMLLSLHAMLSIDIDGMLAKALLLCHLGLFALWQPVFTRRARLEPRDLVIGLVFVAAFVALLNSLLATLWVLLLIGLVSGRDQVRHNERLVGFCTLLMLLLDLLVLCVPETFSGTRINREVQDLFRALNCVLPCVILLIRVDPSAGVRGGVQVDLLRSLTAALLAAVLVGASLIHTYQTGVAYPNAVLESSLGLAAFLIAISWLLSRQTGSGGLAGMWEQSLLNLESSFERWLRRIASLAAQEEDEARFLEQALEELVALPWAAGIMLRDEDTVLELGGQTRHAAQVADGLFDVTLFTHRPAGVSLRLHARLLVQLVEFFYLDKQRARLLAERVQAEAIHDTGARVTHDIKNLLQSLGTVAAQLEHADDPAQRQKALELLGRQVPEISRRLRLALDKLSRPDATPQPEQYIPAGEWLANAHKRHPEPWLEFALECDAATGIPVELFDSVLDNVIDNLRQKHLLEPGIAAQVRVSMHRSAPQLTVNDTGSEIGSMVVSGLFRAPVPSASGLGIGLWQCARLAEQTGYVLKLAENRKGAVCFALARAEDQA